MTGKKRDRQKDRQKGENNKRRYATARQHAVIDLQHEQGASQREDADDRVEQADAVQGMPYSTQSESKDRGAGLGSTREGCTVDDGHSRLPSKLARNCFS